MCPPSENEVSDPTPLRVVASFVGDEAPLPRKHDVGLSASQVREQNPGILLSPLVKNHVEGLIRAKRKLHFESRIVLVTDFGGSRYCHHLDMRRDGTRIGDGQNRRYSPVGLTDRLVAVNAEEGGCRFAFPLFPLKHHVTQGDRR